MGGFIPTHNTVRVDLLQDLAGQHCDNTLWYFNPSGEWSVSDMLAFGSTVNDVWSTNMAPLHCGDWTYRGCVVTNQQSDTAPAVDVPVVAVPGTFTGSSDANNVTWSVKLATSGRGRSAHGRNFVVGVPKNVVSDNRVDLDWANAIVAAYEAMLAPSLDVAGALVVVSHRTGGLDRAEGLAQPVTAIAYADLVVDSQRRRLPGRGN